MKKIFFIFSLLIISSLVFAGGTWKKRNKCVGSLSPRYVTTAEIYPTASWQWCYDKDWTCQSGAYSHCEKYQGSQLECSSYGEVFTNGTGSSNGYKILVPSQAYYSVGEDVTFSKPENVAPIIIDTEIPVQENLYNTGEMRAGETTFDELSNSITIHDLFGSMISYSNDRANNYQVMRIAVYDETEGDYEKTDKLVYEAKAFVYNGQLILEGGFSEDEFINHSNITKTDFELIRNSKVIRLASNVKVNNTIIVVSSDAGNLAMGVPERLRINFHSNKVKDINKTIVSNLSANLTIKENPTKSTLDFTFSNLSNENSSVKFAISTIDGKVVQNLDNSEFKKSESKEFHYDISSLANGIYLLEATNSNGKKYAQKLIKN